MISILLLLYDKKWLRLHSACRQFEVEVGQMQKTKLLLLKETYEIKIEQKVQLAISKHNRERTSR